MEHITLIVLSYNSAQTLARCITSATGMGRSVLVVDSFSTDDSVSIARGLGATVLQHPFVNYSAQRNWASQQVGAATQWLLHLDADEYLTQDLATEIATRAASASPSTAGFLVRRIVRFCGREIRHGGLAGTWHLRLYRVGHGRCEDRLYDQHFVVDGATERLHESFVDDNLSSLELWTAQHNRWSSAEAVESVAGNLGGSRVTPSLVGTPIERKRWLKERLWTRLPLFWRAFAYFGYRYVLRLGFLDGVEGLVFHTLQGFWFRFLIDSKIWEARAPRHAGLR